MPWVVAALLGLAACAAGLRRPGDAEELRRFGMNSTEVPRQRSARDVVIDGLQSEALVWQHYRKYLNTCAKDHPTFLHDLANLKHTIPENMLAAMRKTFGSLKEPAYTLSNSMHLTCMVDNFLVMLSQAVAKKTVVVLLSLDQESHSFCTGRKNEPHIDLRCVDLTGWIEEPPAKKETLKSNGLAFDSCLYIKVTWTKPVLLYHASGMAPHGLIMIDSDIVVHGDLFQWVKENRDADAAIITGDDGGWKQPNSGTIYADENSKWLLERWTDTAGTEEVIQSPRGEQEALFVALKRTKKWKLLQTFPKQAVGQCGRRGQLATHFNCLGQKIVEMTKRGLWQARDPKCV